MAQGSIMEMQCSAILRMLDIGGNQPEPVWKVLVYDNFCLEAMAPLLKISALRSCGVTVQLKIDNERDPQDDVPAVYFLQPTQDNINMIKGDLANGLYERMYINFASSVSQALREELERSALEAKTPGKIASISDRKFSFLSLSSSLFSLNLPEAYRILKSPFSSEDLMIAFIDRIVDGLMSVVITMGTCPIICCSTGESCAGFVAQQLDKRIREFLTQGSAHAAELFSAPTAAAPMPGAYSGGVVSRPLLCIFDRDVDLMSMFLHTWTYQAMAHDVFGMRLNKLKVPVHNFEGGQLQSKTYNIDESDAFWAKHCNKPFHEVVQEIEKYQKSESMSGQDSNAMLTTDEQVAQASNSLAKMVEQKRSTDMHTNIVTALLNEISERELDQYYTMEDQFPSKSTSTGISDIEKLLSGSQKGTLVDKTRASMALYLSKPSMTSAEIQQLTESLEKAGGDASGLAYLVQSAKIRNTGKSMTGRGGNAYISSGGNFPGLTSAAAGSASAVWTRTMWSREIPLENYFDDMKQVLGRDPNPNDQVKTQNGQMVSFELLVTLEGAELQAWFPIKVQITQDGPLPFARALSEWRASLDQFGNFAALSSTATRSASEFMSAGLNNFKNAVASKKESPLCQAFEALMEQKTTGATENHLYLDPKASSASAGDEVARQRAPFRTGIAFVIGGGNYTELQAVQEWAASSGRQVFYGSTDIVSPSQFVQELSHLGAESGGAQ